MPRITVEFVLSHNPCWADAREVLPRLLGEGKTLRECLDVPGVSDADKVWLATRDGACSERVQRLFAAACAESVLHLFEAEYPDDERSRVAIQTAVAFALGQATAEELSDAADAARAAAADADAWAADAAAAAADAAADAAAARAAWAAAAAADAAARAAARASQVETLRALLEEYP